MNFRTFQVCRSTEGWSPVSVPSNSEPGTTYLVFVNPWGNVNENICECKGYLYRFRCSHQQEASDRLCGWIEGRPVGKNALVVEQTPHERKKKRCPMCAGPTKYEVEVND